MIKSRQTTFEMFQASAPSRPSASRPPLSPDERLAACLRPLFRHADANAIALTGGVAIEIHLSAGGWPRPRRALNDVDFVSQGPGAISPRAAAVFLVSHFHLPHAGYRKFMVQLVDPASRLRVDVFPAVAGSIERARLFEIAGVPVRVLDPQAILDHKLALLAGATEHRPIDRKHYDDAVLLGRLCGRRVAELPATSLCKVEYSRDPAAPCARCERSVDPRFPLASRQQILDVLGYV